jgi:hypothetical protein
MLALHETEHASAGGWSLSKLRARWRCHMTSGHNDADESLVMR